MTSVSVDINLDDMAIRSMLNAPSGPLGRYFTRLGMEAAHLAKLNAPVRSGALRASIRYQRITAGLGAGIGVEIVADAPHAAAVIHGTRPHTIRPRSGKVLKFPGKGSGAKMVYARSVKHPGTKGNPFLSEALRQTVAMRGLG